MVVRLILSLIVGLALSLAPTAFAMKQLELKSHAHIAAIDIPLNDKAKAWLAAQPTLIVGTWLPEMTPIVYDSDEESYQGINADYLALMAHSLGLKVVIRQYDTEQQALAALADRQVDTLLTQVAHRDALAPGLVQSAPLIKTWPTLVTSLKSPLPPLTTDRRVKLACTRDCAFFDIIQQAFPNAKITLYDSDYQALASVVSGENQYFIGNNITTGHCISKYFSQSLVITHYFRQQEQHNRFVTREDRPALHQLLDRFIHAIDSDTAMRIMQNWLNRGDLSFLNTPLPFTAEEQRWLRKHRHIRLLVNPYFPPFTLVDDEDELRGIMADMLNIFSLQTGLQFDPILVRNRQDLAKRMEKEDWAIMPAATLTPQPQAYVTLSEPLINVAFVLVARGSAPDPHLLTRPSRIALPVGPIAAHDLKARFPQVNWVETDNVGVAMKMVEEGEVDAAVASELSARYMIDHYYPQDLHYTRIDGLPVAAIRLAIPRDEPVLAAVLNKALQAIPPRDILQMTEKWSKISSQQIENWSQYSRQFYQLIAFALVLIAISLGWGLSLCREVRKRKDSQQRLEEELAQKEALSCALEREKDKAIQATKAKSRFLASMSHELRTPVSAIVGFLELLAKPELNVGQRKEAIELAGSTAQTLLGLIGNILDIDKIESGKYQITPQWSDVAQVVSQQCHTFGALAQQKGIALWVDPQALRQILNNLIGNALKFTAEGAIQISCRLARADETQGELTLIVSDSGCGISEAEQATLFHRYAQARQGRQQTGSGLGLVICQELVTLMQGRLEMVSRPGVGTTFTITLPVRVSRCAIHAPQALPVRPQALPGLSILIADDHPTNRLLLKRQLNTIGYSVDEACDGEEAENKLAGKHYDLLITDLNMPKKDGLALAASLRRRYPSLVIWGVTASALPQSREACLASGMNMCLFKPVSVQTLSHELSRLAVGHASPNAARHLKLSVLTENTGGDQALMAEMLETFRDASATDLQAAGQAIARHEPQTFLRALHRLHGSAQILGITALQQLCAPFEAKRPDSLTPASCLEVVQHITGILCEIDGEIDALIGR
ncbi:ATP-binding protein [Klebsiella quasipneumoniae]|uniref:ATP-binding protein n=1 Tax=Klebsiella quasipneumoniae TaxID=1463165 RepID=UPI00238119E5|nr:transporter substrate-binding domain-containing protein [Klebsiella quasipneumoniae]MDE4645922.1 transporter substrate-binding domain-containing protein [Klebsiella quasipneumoniae subsp. similipneumoniae]